LGLEVGDDLFDAGVLAVLGLDELDRFGAVGGDREVSPGGKQLAAGVLGGTRRTITRRPWWVVSAICARPVSG
jgi:hypothetical protein